MRTSTERSLREAFVNTLMARVMARGWLRCLPVEAGCMLLIVATASAIGLRGEEMWEHVETLWQQSKNYRPSSREQRALEDVEWRFKKMYGINYERTARGTVQLLIELGLVIRYEVEGEEVLDIPDILPMAKT